MWNVDFMDKVLILKLVRDLNFCVEIIENRIYIRGEFTRKSVKRPFCSTVSILQVVHIFMLYNLLGPGISFIENLKLLLKENQIMK